MTLNRTPMTKQIFSLLIAATLVVSCGQKDNNQTVDQLIDLCYNNAYEQDINQF